MLTIVVVQYNYCCVDSGGLMQAAIKHHRKHHRINGWLPRMKECFRCAAAKDKCDIKRTYKSRQVADKQALSHNISVRWWPDECRYVYRCFFCSDWHLTTAHLPRDTNKIEKMRRKWLRRTHQKDNLGWTDGTERGDWDIPA